jgi:thiamine pyrophosphokinase
MSSHHIVREKQEPALLILGLDGFTDDLLGQLLEWSPTVITVPDIAERLVAYGIKVDWVTAAGDNETQQPDVKILPSGADNALVAALKYLTDNEYPSVNVITDELKLANYHEFVNQIDIVLFHHGKRIYPVHPGFRKWKPAGETIEILSPMSNLSITGLEKINEYQYKTTADGFFSLHFDGQFLFIGEEI